MFNLLQENIILLELKGIELTSESLHDSFSTPMSWSNENKSCMRVDKREFVQELSQFSCFGQTRTRFA